MEIFFNQIGYQVGLKKRAVISDGGTICEIRSLADDKVVLKPEVSPPFVDAASGDTVRTVDFSKLDKPGAYWLYVDGKKRKISIDEKPYRSVGEALVKGLYYQRCGCELKKEHAGPYAHGVCHRQKTYRLDDPTVMLDVSGGWHDAGDYGRYIAPAAVTVAHMLYAYERFPNVFGDQLNIPESGNGVPDLIDECRFEIDWMLKMQSEDGGLYHKVATRYFAPFIMPEEDKEDLIVFRVTHTATAGFAACLALAYRIYLNFDAPYAHKLLAAAKKAWQWLVDHPEFEPFVNPPQVNSGAYDDASVEDEIFWAACELYAATGEESFQKEAVQRLDHVDLAQLGWQNVAGFGSLCCLSIGSENVHEKLWQAVQKSWLATADKILEFINASGYHTALPANGYIWGSNLPVLNRAIVLIVAYQMTGNQRYEEGALAQLDYLFGVNALGISFVTGFGENAFRFPHHRPSDADGIPEPVPGFVSGGPNKENPDEDTLLVVPADRPAAKFYCDHTPSAGTNEIAIYWNSPAIWVVAYFNNL